MQADEIRFLWAYDRWATRQVLAWREFDSVVPSSSEDPYGGVLAANLAVQKALESLAAFCAETARSARPPASTTKPD